MKKYLISIMTLLAIMFGTSAKATQLPSEIKDYIIKNVPEASIRFDGLITLPDGTFYLPLIPSFPTKKEESLTVKYTYPENKSFDKKPEILIFNNNYCLLKLIKTKDKSLTITELQDIPIEVRSGLLPQDLLVPKGLVLPDSMIGILGDLNIPLSSNLKINEAKKIPNNIEIESDLPKAPKRVDVISQLKDKQFFITNFSSNLIYIMPSDMNDVQFTLKLESIPKTVQEVEGKYLLVATNGKTYIDIVDVQNEEIAKQIDLGVVPDEIVVSNDEKTAYVVSNNHPYLYVIDISKMALSKQVQLKGMPEKINLSSDESKLIYIDNTTSDIYSVELKNDFVTIYQCNVPNAVKMMIIDNQVYVLSRTKNKLKVFPYQEFVVEKTDEDEEVLGAKKSYYIKSAFWAKGSAVRNYLKHQEEQEELENYVEEGQAYETKTKPVDMLYRNGKIFILSAITNSIDIFNVKKQKIEKNISLQVPGFSNKFNVIKNSDLVLITNVADKRYVIFDLDGQSVVQVNPIDVQMTTLTVVNKTQKIKNEEKEEEQEPVNTEEEINAEAI